MNTKLLLPIFFTVVLCFEAYAIGISPPTIMVDFEPYYKGEHVYIITNNGDQDMTAEVEAIDELAAYFEPNKTSIDITAHSAGRYTFRVLLPEYLEPGLRFGRIKVVGNMKSAIPGMFNVRAAVVGDYIVRVPYPGKYLDYDWNFNNINENESVLFKIDVYSRGNETLKEVYGFIDIYDLKWNTIVSRIPSTKINDLESLKTGTIYAGWDSKGNPPGLYYVKLSLYYDGLFKEETRQLRIGTRNLKIVNFTSYFEPETINKFSILIESLWNDQIDNVYAEVKVSNATKDFEVFRTPTKSLPGWSSQTLDGYWDSHGAALGDYYAKVKVFFGGDLSVTQESIIHVVEKKIQEQNPEASTKQPKLSELYKENKVLVLTFVSFSVMTLLLITLLVILVLKNKKSKNINTSKYRK
jgi:hypothetical protein